MSQNLTEFNTAHNRRISMLGITDDDVHKATRKRKKKGITFNDDEEVINPEDVDPSVGRFRNLIQTTVVPSKVRLVTVIRVEKMLKALFVKCFFSSLSECEWRVDCYLYPKKVTT